MFWVVRQTVVQIVCKIKIQNVCYNCIYFIIVLQKFSVLDTKSDFILNCIKTLMLKRFRDQKITFYLINIFKKLF